MNSPASLLWAAENRLYFLSRCHTSFERQGMKGLLCYTLVQTAPNTVPDRQLMVTCYGTKFHMDSQIVVYAHVCPRLADTSVPCRW